MTFSASDLAYSASISFYLLAFRRTSALRCNCLLVVAAPVAFASVFAADPVAAPVAFASVFAAAPVAAPVAFASVFAAASVADPVEYAVLILHDL